MKLVTYSVDGRQSVGFLVKDQVCDLGKAAGALNFDIEPGADLVSVANNEYRDLLGKIEEAAQASLDDGWCVPLNKAKLHAPYRPRQNILIAGGNTPDEFVPQRMRNGKAMLRYHTKAPSAVIGPGEEISWPRQLTTQVHAEPHLAVVIGETTSYVEPSEVMSKVFGFTVATNVVAQDLKRKHGQWDKAVSLDTFMPWGPVVVTADEVDVGELACRLWLNERMAVSGGAESGLLKTADVLSELSFGMVLHPGDVVLTGTAESVGHGEVPERWLQDGDVVQSAIEGVVQIMNPVSTY